MKKITIEKNMGQPLTVYFADDAFVHIRPAPTKEQQAELIKFSSASLANAGKTGNYYLQYAYFNPLNEQQLKMLYAEETALGNIIQMSPHYTGAANNPANIEDFQSEDVTNNFQTTRKAATESICGEHKPPVPEEKESIPHKNQDSPQRKMEATRKLYKFILKNKAGHEEASLFSQYVVEPDTVFSAELSKISQDKKIIAASTFIQTLRDSIPNENDLSIREYLIHTANYLEKELNLTLDTTTKLIMNSASQLDRNEERIKLYRNIATYTQLKDSRSALMSGLVTALYQAAKDYYYSIWEHEKHSLNTGGVVKFNKIFGALVTIDPQNLSLSTIENAFKTLDSNKLKTESIEKMLSDMLNASYRDAIEFIIKQLGEFDPNQQHFSLISRKIITNHKLRFSDTTRNMLVSYDQAHQQLLATTREDIDIIYTTGTELIEKAREVTKTDGPQAEDTRLADLYRMSQTAQQNIGEFVAIVTQKNALSEIFDNLAKKLDSHDMSLNDLNLPQANQIDEASIAEGADAQLNKEYMALTETIQNERSTLGHAVKSMKEYVKTQKELLEHIVAQSTASSIHLSPVAKTEVTLSWETQQVSSPQDALEHASENAKRTERKLKDLMSSIQHSRKKLSSKVASIHLLAALHTTTMKVTELKMHTKIAVADHGYITDLAAQADAQHAQLLQALNDESKNLHDREEALTDARDSLTKFPALLAYIESKYETLQSKILDTKAHMQATKNDADDILKCQLLVNTLLNFQHWNTTVGTFGTHTQVTVNNQSYIVPQEIGAILALLKQNPDWDTNANAAREMIQTLKKNHAKALAMGLRPEHPTRVRLASVNAIQAQPSTFWQRHPVLKKTLLGALIGTIIPVLGTLIGAFIGYAVGKREARRAQQLPMASPEEQQPLLRKSIRPHVPKKHFTECRPSSAPRTLFHTNNPIPVKNNIDKKDFERAFVDILVSKFPPAFYLSSINKKTSSQSLAIQWERKADSKDHDSNMRKFIQGMKEKIPGCTDEKIKEAVREAAEPYHDLDVKLFKNSPLMEYDLKQIIIDNQRRYDHE